jgi:outer membrane lipoprotein carrier protein
MPAAPVGRLRGIAVPALAAAWLLRAGAPALAQVPAAPPGGAVTAAVVAAPAVSPAPAGPAPAPPSTPGATALREVAGLLLGLDSYQAEFEQTQDWVGMDAPASARGTLYLRRPNLFRIEYAEPKGHLQVSDGTRVWTWVPENGEVLLARLSDGPGGSGDPLRWVLENGRAEPGVETDTTGGGTARVISLIPAAGSGLKRVRLWTRPGSPDLIRYEYEDDGGNRTLYRLTRTRKNPPLDPGLFRFTPPAGVPVVELGAP